MNSIALSLTSPSEPVGEMKAVGAFEMCIAAQLGPRNERSDTATANRPIRPLKRRSECKWKN